MHQINYWDNRYRGGGTSGCGSIGELREWKWKVINMYCPSIKSVVDMGCGDLSFWGDKKLAPNFFGVDGSEEIIQKNKEKYPDALFRVSLLSYRVDVTSPVVFCLDVLFHILDDKEYISTVKNLCDMTKGYLFIYTWFDNPLRKWWIFPAINDDYQKYHDPVDLVALCTVYGMHIEYIHRNKGLDLYGAMFVFRRKE